MAEPAPAPEPMPAKKPEPPPKKIVLQGVNFDHDKATLKPEARAILDNAVEVIRSSPGYRFHISGHTDSQGTDSYNQGLSERRANAVRDYLVQNGVSSNRLSLSAHGESLPVASNETAAGRARNRRVEIEPVK